MFSKKYLSEEEKLKRYFSERINLESVSSAFAEIVKNELRSEDPVSRRNLRILSGMMAAKDSFFPKIFSSFFYQKYHRVFKRLVVLPLFIAAAGYSSMQLIKNKSTNVGAEKPKTELPLDKESKLKKDKKEIEKKEFLEEKKVANQKTPEASRKKTKQKTSQKNSYKEETVEERAANNLVESQERNQDKNPAKIGISRPQGNEP